jgi:hypothetical protein
VYERGKVCLREKVQRRKRYVRENMCEREIIYVYTRKRVRERQRGEVKHNLLFLA